MVRARPSLKFTNIVSPLTLTTCQKMLDFIQHATCGSLTKSAWIHFKCWRNTRRHICVSVWRQQHYEQLQVPDGSTCCFFWSCSVCLVHHTQESWGEHHPVWLHWLRSYLQICKSVSLSFTITACVCVYSLFLSATRSSVNSSSGKERKFINIVKEHEDIDASNYSVLKCVAVCTLQLQAGQMWHI